MARALAQHHAVLRAATDTHPATRTSASASNGESTSRSTSPLPPLDCIIPASFLIVPGDQTDDRAALLAYEENTTTTSGRRAPLWICKASSGAHGAGIQICASGHEAIAHVDAQKLAVANDGRVQVEGKGKGSRGGNTSEAMVTGSGLPDQHHEEEEEQPKEEEEENNTNTNTNTSVASLPPWRRARGGRTKPQPVWVVQTLVANPLLFRGRKFYIRAVAILTPDRRVLFFTGTLCRGVGGAPWNRRGDPQNPAYGRVGRRACARKRTGGGSVRGGVDDFYHFARG